MQIQPCNSRPIGSQPDHQDKVPLSRMSGNRAMPLSSTMANQGSLISTNDKKTSNHKSKRERSSRKGDRKIHEIPEMTRHVASQWSQLDAETKIKFERYARQQKLRRRKLEADWRNQMVRQSMSSSVSSPPWDAVIEEGSKCQQPQEYTSKSPISKPSTGFHPVMVDTTISPRDTSLEPLKLGLPQPNGCSQTEWVSPPMTPRVSCISPCTMSLHRQGPGSPLSTANDSPRFSSPKHIVHNCGQEGLLLGPNPLGPKHQPLQDSYSKSSFSCTRNRQPQDHQPRCTTTSSTITGRSLQEQEEQPWWSLREPDVDSLAQTLKQQKSLDLFLSIFRGPGQHPC